MVRSVSEAQVDRDSRRQEIVCAQARLLYATSGLAVGVTVLAASILVCLEWGSVPKSVISGWWTYMALVSISRYTLTRRFHRVSPAPAATGKWLTAFAICAGLSGAGWGGSAIVLYPNAQPTNQVFLVFVVGGMMLGASSVLAPRREAFLAFLVPAGLIPAVRLVLEGDETHLAMGVLAGVFTVAVLIATDRIYNTLDSSIRLQFENRDLVNELQAAKAQTEALNQALELRVEERTSELLKSTDRLRAEIVRREEMEDELLRARKLESLGVLAGGIAHDFNNILTVIQGNIEMAKDRLDSGDPIREILDETAGTCRRAASLSSQLLTFAKGGAPVRSLTSVGKLVLDAVQLVRAGSPISFEVDIAGDLRFADVDPGQIGQVLHNILLNARQAVAEGGVVKVRAENGAALETGADPLVRISIRDNGCGIPADILPKIFDPYFTTKPTGSGLGLATAYSIVTRHSGRIAVESEPGVGSVFTVELPASHETPVRRALNPATVPTGRERLLVMDDEESLRKLLAAVLAKSGYQVQTARDGVEAIALFQEAKAAGKGFDAVLLDLTVSGGMGGIETAARLKKLDPSAKLIVSSGYSDAAVMSKFAEYGFEAVIPKPWTIPELTEVFRRVLAVDS